MTNFFKDYAVKIMRVPDIEYFNIAMKEFKLLEAQLDHPNIIKAHDMYYNRIQEKIYMVMDYVEGCNLEEFIAKKNTKIEEKEIVNIIYEVL